MWLIIIRITYALIALLLVTQVIIPLLTDKPLFGLFKKTKRPLTNAQKLSFDEAIEQAARVADEAKQQKAKSDADIDDKISKVNNLNKHK